MGLHLSPSLPLSLLPIALFPLFVVAGEELSITYLNDDDMALDTQSRKAKLASTYGFVCRCLRCADEGKRAAAAEGID